MKKIYGILAVGILLIGSIGTAIVLTEHNSGDDDEIIIEDMLGTKVNVVRNPKVACVSRTTYDLLVAFGLGNYVDGGYRTIYDNPWAAVLYPESVNDHCYQYEESYETFYNRGIDLVLCPEVYIAEGLRNHGIDAITVSLYGDPSFEQYLYFMADLAISLWGDVDGVREKAEQWKLEFGTAIESITAVLDQQDDKGTKNIYYVRGDKNKGVCYTDTGSSFNEYTFRMLGFNFIGDRFETPSPSIEALLSADPDIVVIGGIYQHVLEDILKTDSIWSNMSAVQADAIYRIPVGFSPFEQISTFSPIFLYDMANKLYPDLFGYDVAHMTLAYCSEYFGIDLSNQQVQYMLDGLAPDGGSLV